MPCLLKERERNVSFLSVTRQRQRDRERVMDDLVLCLQHAVFAAHMGVQVLPVPDILAQTAGIRRVIVITEIMVLYVQEVVTHLI